MRNRLLIAALVLAGPLALAQLPPSPDEAPVSHAPAPAIQVEDAPVSTMKMTVNRVDVLFTVRAKDGSIVPHLTKDDCTVLEDKQPQTLKTFQAETHLPLTLGVLLDTSGSQTRVLDLEKDSGSQFLQRVVKPKDEAFLISVDVNVDLLQDLTNNVRLLTRALYKAEINSGVSFGASPVPTPNGPRGTILYDGVYLAVREKLNQESGRKALILLTDGEDEGSKTKIQEAIAAAQKANVSIYVVLLADVQAYMSQGMGYFGYSAMKKMAEETGGRVINVGNNGKKLEDAFAQIEEELRTQYIATYSPLNPLRDGKFRKLAVECKGDSLRIQTRKGYYAPKDE